MDEPSLSAWADELDSKDTKRRLQALEALGSALELRPWSQPPSAAQEELARIYDDNSWQRLVAPLVCTLRDNNFKVCRASLACLESLVARVTESDAHSGRIGGGGGGGRNGSGSSSSGNANSIVPFLSLITPAVVDCLGNSKAAVQEKGVSVLLAISDPLVAGAHDTISSVQQHFGRHRNWRVRERLVAYLGRAAELDSAGVNRVQQQRAAAAVGKESSLLAQLLGDALNDSASQVRQEALAAAERVVEVLRGDGGPVLLAQLEARGVRRSALATLRDTSSKSGGTNGESGENSSSTASAGGGGLLSPLTPAPLPSSRTAAAAATTRTAHRAAAAAAAGQGSAGGIGGGGAARLPSAATRRRRPAAGGGETTGGGGRRGASSSVLTRGGAAAAEGGGGGGASTPMGAVTIRRGGGGSGRAISPTAVVGISPLGVALSSGGGEESAFSALERLETVTVYTERDVRREVEAAKTGLEHGSDWQKWVSAMRRLAGVALGGGGSEFPALLVGLVRASVHEMVGHKVSENRSAVAREACRCVAVLARCLTDHFGALAELWLPELLRNTTRAVVVAAAGDEAARAVFGCTKDGFPRLLQYLVDTSKNKSAAIRRRCLDYVMLALARWSDAAFDRYAPQIRGMITAAIGDADSSVRATARRAYWVLGLRFPDLAQSVMGSLAPSAQRHVLREDREFDAEAFVRAADAAAEDPQPALGEHINLDGDNDDEHGAAAAAAAATPGAADLSASSNSDAVQAPPPSAASAARRMHGTHHGSSAAGGGGGGSGGHQPPQRRPLVANAAAEAAAESSGGGLMAGRTAVGLSTRIKADGAAVSGEGSAGSSARVPRAGGGAPAWRSRAGRLTAQDGSNPAGDADPSSSGTAASAGEDAGDGGADGSRSWDPLSALRVAGGGVAGVGGDTTAAATTAAKTGASRVPRGGGAAAASGGETVRAFGGGGGIGSSESSHQRAPATRVVARRPSLVAPVSAAGGGGDQQAFGGSGTLGVASKVGRGAQHAKIVGRQQQQQQHCLDGGTLGRQGEEAVEKRADGAPMRGTVNASMSVSVVLDRRDVLRQMDELADQARVSHWAARAEALDRLSQLLTSGGGGDGIGTGGEGGRFVLESRPASRRLEVVIAERARDANFRVVTAALKVLGALVEAHPMLMAGHASALLPSVFPNLADAKEPVRLAANGVLNACRAAYPPHQLCYSLCPRVLELPPGRARTGLLEFLAVLVPHSASFFLPGTHPAAGGGGGGHLQSLTQRVAAALVQSPPPANWDGGLGDDGPTSAGSAASAAIRLLTSLFRLDREAFAAASAGLQPESAVAVRRALSFCASPPSSCSYPVGEAGGVAGDASPEATGKRTEGDEVAAGAGGSPVRLSDAVLQEQEDGAAVTPAAGEGSGRAGFEGEVGSSPGGSEVRSPSPPPSPSPLPALAAAAAASPAASGTPVSSTSGSAFAYADGDETRGRAEANSALFTPPPQQKPQRRPLAPVTPRDTNGRAGERNGRTAAGGSGGAFSAHCGVGKPNKNMSPAAPTPKGVHAAATPPAWRTPANSAKVNTEERKAADTAAVARGLITGLSRGARSHQKVEALSSLRRLADGEGAGGRPDFWPRYFGQVLMLLLEGAAAAGEGVDGGGRSASPSRRRVLLRAKHLQGVRCLVARRGKLFPESTEVLVGRLVEIGAGAGDACLAAVRSEAEACLADLAAVLDPARYLEVLTPLLALPPAGGAADEASAAGMGDGAACAGAGGELRNNVSMKTQCFVLGALRALTPRLSSPKLLGALSAGPLLSGLEAALGGRDLEARKRGVLALVEMYQVLEEALLPFLAGFPTSRLKLITMYIEQRRVKDNRAAAAERSKAESGGGGGAWAGAARDAGAQATRFTPIR